jgi:virulence factor Mce-like protein
MRTSSALLARLIGAGLVFGSIGLAVASFVPPQLPWSRTLHVTVASSAFGEMNPQAGVELGGVRIGSVEKIDYTNHAARLHLAIDPAYADRLHADAGATIQPHGLLGPKYVSLTSGSKGRMKDGGTIPQSRTKVTTDFDQVLNALQPDVRQNLQVIFVELGTASDGRGGDMNQALQSLAQASDNMKTVTAELQSREPDTTTFVVSSEEFNRDVQNAPIAQNIADTNRVLSDLVQVENELAGSIDHTAGVLQSVTVIMDGNSPNLAYVLGHSPKTVKDLNSYLTVNTAVINGIRPSLPNLLTAVVEGESVVSGRDANGHYVRVLAISGACTVGPDPTGACSSPNAPASASAPPSGGSSTDGSSPSTPGRTNRPRQLQTSYTPMTDQQLMALFLGG